MTSTTGLPILKTDTRGRVRTPAADQEALVALFEQGGISGAAFARLHGIRYSTFMHWRGRRRKAAMAGREASAMPLFHEIEISGRAAGACSGVVVELPMGARVRVERADQIPFVAALCRHLREHAGC